MAPTWETRSPTPLPLPCHTKANPLLTPANPSPLNPSTPKLLSSEAWVVVPIPCTPTLPRKLPTRTTQPCSSDPVPNTVVALKVEVNRSKECINLVRWVSTTFPTTWTRKGPPLVHHRPRSPPIRRVTILASWRVFLRRVEMERRGTTGLLSHKPVDFSGSS